MSGPQGHYRFDGATMAEQPDGDSRLLAQWERVHDALVRHGWTDLTAISRLCGAPEASVSARLRDLRKPRFHGHTVGRKHLGGGLFVYRVEPTVRCPRCVAIVGSQMQMEVA